MENIEKIETIRICDANGAVLFDLDKDREEIIVNSSINVLGDLGEHITLRLKDFELKDSQVFFKELQKALKTDKDQIENPYKCQKALWNKMSRIQREKYNQGMRILEETGDLFHKVNGKACDTSVIAHNALILLQKIL